MAGFSKTQIQGTRFYAASLVGVSLPFDALATDLRSACLQLGSLPPLQLVDLRDAKLYRTRFSRRLSHRADLRGVDFDIEPDIASLESRLTELREADVAGTGERLDAAALRARPRPQSEIPPAEGVLNLVLLSEPPPDQLSKWATAGTLRALQWNWAQEVTRQACGSKFLTEALLERAAGILPPGDRGLERVLAQALMRQRGSECEAYQRVDPRAWWAVCAAWPNLEETSVPCVEIERQAEAREPVPPPPPRVEATPHLAICSRSEPADQVRGVAPADTGEGER